MSKITVEVNEELLEELSFKDKNVIRQIFELGLTQLKIEVALRRYKEGGMSLGYAAQLAGVPKREIILQARARGIVPPFSEQTVQEELGRPNG